MTDQPPAQADDAELREAIQRAICSVNNDPDEDWTEFKSNIPPDKMPRTKAWETFDAEWFAVWPLIAARLAAKDAEIAATKHDAGMARKSRDAAGELLKKALAEAATCGRRAEAAEAALKPFCFGDPVLEEILFGQMPDIASGTITVRLGDLRRDPRSPGEPSG